jgi:hypothetical protein
LEERRSSASAFFAGEVSGSGVAGISAFGLSRRLFGPWPEEYGAKVLGDLFRLNPLMGGEEGM